MKKTYIVLQGTYIIDEVTSNPSMTFYVQTHMQLKVYAFKFYI